MEKIHNSIQEKSSLYNFWHKTPKISFLHFLLFVLVLIFALQAISQATENMVADYFAPSDLAAIANVNIPVITSPLTASGMVGQPFSYQMTATNGPISLYGCNAIPKTIPGLTCDSATGLISGIPQAPLPPTGLPVSVTSTPYVNGYATIQFTIDGGSDVFNTLSMASRVTLIPGDVYRFFPQVLDKNKKVVSWNLYTFTGTQGVNANAGYYSADTPGTFPITATATGVPGASLATASAEVTVVPDASFLPAATSIKISGPDKVANSTIFETRHTAGVLLQAYDANGTLQLIHADDPLIEWSVSGGGVINPNPNHTVNPANATFFAGPTPGNYVITAKWNGLVTTFPIEVTNPPSLSTVTLSPASSAQAPIQVPSGATQIFTVGIFDQFGNSLGNKTINGKGISGDCGTVSGALAFTAGNNVGHTCAVWVNVPFGTFTSDVLGEPETAFYSAVQGVAYVTVADAPTPASITLSTSATTLLPNASAHITANVKDQYGKQMSPVLSWSADSGISVPPSGYTADAVVDIYAKGSYVVTAKSSNGVTANITLTVPTVFKTLQITPTSVTLPFNGKQQFTVTALDQTGTALDPQPSLTYAVTNGGSISSSGLFSGTVAGSHSVSVTNSVNALVAKAFVFVNGPSTAAAPSSPTPTPTPAPQSPSSTTPTPTPTTATPTPVPTPVDASQTIATISISPTNPSIPRGGSQQFSATAYNSAGVALSPQPTFAWSGQISPDFSNNNGLITVTPGATVGASHIVVVAVPKANKYAYTSFVVTP
ncbi:MAG: hypothetical protein PHV93_01020 [Candidatus Pacebacteria bacterium]|nr:hypothetical protein [Candidatus Paceibacterota bacterium]